MRFFYCFFFFQAEDGIRDGHVTGVQTCALPILGKMLLSEETECFAFIAGHESFAAAEGAIGIARTANKVRKKPLRVILNGLGKDAAYIISRINEIGRASCRERV